MMKHNEYMCRAKAINTGKWVYGYYIYHINRTIAFGDTLKSEDEKHYLAVDGFSDWNMPRGIRLISIDPATLCRCTGIVDKNNKLIFENDMLDAPYNIVSYQSNLNEGLGMNCGWYLQRDNFESWRELQAEQYYEIIGNTIDPELLQTRR